MNSVISVRELRAFKNPKTLKTVFPTDLPDSYIESMCDLALETIERLTRNRFRKYQETWRIDGSGTNVLRFPPCIPYPLLSVTNVRLLADKDTIEEELVLDEDYVNCGHFLKIADWGNPSIRKLVGNRTGNGYFERGVKNYEIVGVWGMETAPAAIKHAVSLLTVELTYPGVLGLQSQMVAQQSWPDYTVTFKAANVGSTSSVTLTEYAEIDRLIKPYANWSTLFMRGDTVAYLVSSEEVYMSSDVNNGMGGVYILQADPLNPVAGSIWYNATERIWKFVDNSDPQKVVTLGTAAPTNTPRPPLNGAQDILVYVTDPSLPYEGQIWFNGADRVFKGFNGVQTFMFGTPAANTDFPMKGNEVQIYTTDPEKPETGTIWFNLHENKWKMMQGSGVVILGE